MERREAVFCNPQGREILGLWAMSQREPECCDGKWALGGGSAEGESSRRGSSPGPVGGMLLLSLRSGITGPRALGSGPSPEGLVEAGPGSPCLYMPPAFQQSPALS